MLQNGLQVGDCWECGFVLHSRRSELESRKWSSMPVCEVMRYAPNAYYSYRGVNRS